MTDISDLKVAVLASGSGTNFEAIARRFPENVKLLLTNNPEAGAIKRAQSLAIDHKVIDHREFDGRGPFEEALVSTLQEASIDWICLAGFMRVLTPAFLEAFPNRVLNIHPSILPAFPGLNAQQQTADYGVRFAGATVHIVDAGTDTGPIVAQAIRPVDPDSSAQVLTDQILELEHRLYPHAVKLVLTGRAEVQGRKVKVYGGRTQSEPMFNPPLDRGK